MYNYSGLMANISTTVYPLIALRYRFATFKKTCFMKHFMYNYSGLMANISTTVYPHTFVKI